MHLDQHVVGARDRLVDVDHPDVGGAGGLEDLDGSHGSIMSPAEPPPTRTRLTRSPVTPVPDVVTPVTSRVLQPLTSDGSRRAGYPDGDLTPAAPSG